jgi:transcriptional regulator with XRE-family HTH domain
LLVLVAFYWYHRCAVFGSDLLVSRRRQARLTQEALAYKAGVTVATVAHLEQGRELNPRLGTCEKLAVALGCSVCDLVSPELNPKQVGAP